MRRRREQRSPAAVTLPSADGGAGYLPDRYYVNKDSSPAAGRHGTQVLKRVSRPGKRRGQPTTTAVPRGAGARASYHRVARVDLRWRRADTSACYSAILYSPGTREALQSSHPPINNNLCMGALGT